MKYSVGDIVSMLEDDVVPKWKDKHLEFGKKYIVDYVGWSVGYYMIREYLSDEVIIDIYHNGKVSNMIDSRVLELSTQLDISIMREKKLKQLLS